MTAKTNDDHTTELAAVAGDIARRRYGPLAAGGMLTGRRSRWKSGVTLARSGCSGSACPSIWAAAVLP